MWHKPGHSPRRTLRGRVEHFSSFFSSFAGEPLPRRACPSPVGFPSRPQRRCLIRLIHDRDWLSCRFLSNFCKLITLRWCWHELFARLLSKWCCNAFTFMFYSQSFEVDYDKVRVLTGVILNFLHHKLKLTSAVFSIICLPELLLFSFYCCKEYVWGYDCRFSIRCLNESFLRSLLRPCRLLQSLWTN